MAGISDPFVAFGAAARAKFLLLGRPDSAMEALVNQVRSLNIEHVSPVRLKGPEISRRPAKAAAEEVATLALMRRWFFARKPDAGFVLTDFPATLLQAQVLDEWLETRDEALNAVFASGSGSSEAVLQHYRTLGLLQETSVPATDGLSSVAFARESTGAN
jgi:adenylate kinase